MPSALVHLICGSTGAGKTTYALDLEARIADVRFSIDQWMMTLFWMDSPQPLVPAWSIERVERCTAQIMAVTLAVAARGVPCILDLGFSQQAARARVAGLARRNGQAVQLHYLDVPATERWRRVEARNAGRGATCQLGFDVTHEMFDFVEGIWEPPGEAELAACNGVRIASG